jgi:hypothetical protein
VNTWNPPCTPPLVEIFPLPPVQREVGLLHYRDDMSYAEIAQWKLSLLVAGLSTVGIFLRLRTARLAEIQLRLAALEEMLAKAPEPPDSGGTR